MRKTIGHSFGPYWARGAAIAAAVQAGRGRSVALAMAAALSTLLLPPAVAPAQVVSGPRAVLERPREPLVGPSFPAIGSDPAAPRALVLWRFDGAVFQRVAETRSGDDGRFDFGLVPLPLDHADFAVAAAGAAPARDDLIPLERALPAPLVAGADAADARLLVLPARDEGELLVSDVATGRLLARIAIEADAGRGTGIDLVAMLPRVWPAAIAIAHRLPDGRRSPPEIWPLYEPDTR